ncbi:MAG: type IX secretion system membrane protein PorP/SprF [Sphingobacteriales bacterium]|nr:MAG: type IX secretion system membrane protein PorP/SprF [Sphingobacteriales bacterium]
MKKHLKTIIPALCLSLSANAQDIHFSQFYENVVLRNPALTGIFSGDYRAGVNYRTQWSNISAPFRTILATAETRVATNTEGDYFSFGLSTTYDHAGTINFNSFQAYPAVNFNKSIDGNRGSYLSFGFAGGYIQRSVDLSKATYSTQYVGGSYSALNNSQENITNTTIQNWDLAAGISLNSAMGPYNKGNYYLGAAAYHVTKPKHSFNPNDNFMRLDTKWTVNMGFKYNINDEFSIVSHSNYLQQGAYQEIITGGLLSWRGMWQADGMYIGSTPGYFNLYAGAYIRYKDAIIPTIKVDYSYYSLTCSYDINTSPLKTGTNGVGGFEMSLFIRGKFAKSSTEQTRCPHFEQMLPAF